MNTLSLLQEVTECGNPKLVLLEKNMLPTIFIVMGCSLVAFATGAAVFGLAVRRAIHSSARAEILRWSIVLFAALLSYFAGLFFITGGVHWVSTFPALLTGYIALNSIHRITSAPIVIEA